MENTPPPPPRSPRKVTVIPGSFQLRYVLLIVGFMAPLTLLIFTDVVWFIRDLLLVNPGRPDLELLMGRVAMAFYLRFALYILSVTFFLFVLFHRLAGPVLRFSRLAKSIVAGDLTQRVSLRKYDGFKGLQEELNRMADFLNQCLSDDRRNVQKAMDDLSRLKEKGLSPDARSLVDGVLSSLGSVTKQFKL